MEEGRRKKSHLMTPDPYHTPGYAGYVPQFKYGIGKTFGSHTHKLLSSSDPIVASSGNSVLGEILPPRPHSLSSRAAASSTTSGLRNRTRSLGDQKYVTQMVPGYTGYIPKGLHYFGNRYAETCDQALTYFEEEQDKLLQKTNELKALTRRHTAPPSIASGSSQMTTPLRPIASKAQTYRPDHSKKYSTPPYYMPDGDHEKYHISGYTGFIPKARKYIGQSYPVTTCLAHREHSAEGERLKRSWNEPIKIIRPVEKVMGSVGIYPKDTGIVPRYTGHIPGYKYKFGGTFGSSTRDAAPHIYV